MEPDKPMRTINLNGKKWYSEFRYSRTSMSDHERSRRPKELTIHETIEKFHNMVLTDWRLKFDQIVEAIGI